MTDTNRDDVESLTAELSEAQATIKNRDEHIDKLKKENGKWRLRYRQASKNEGQPSMGSDPDDENTDNTDGGSAGDRTDNTTGQQANQADQQATDATSRAEAAEAALRTARIHLAFVEANLQRAEPFKDADLALAQCDLGAVKVNDDGTVAGLNEAMDYVAGKYPYLVDDTDQPSPADTKDVSDFVAGRSTHRPKKRETAEANLIEKYPALRRR